jgi:hypothetical protein
MGKVKGSLDYWCSKINSRRILLTLGKGVVPKSIFRIVRSLVLQRLPNFDFDMNPLHIISLLRNAPSSCVRKI